MSEMAFFYKDSRIFATLRISCLWVIRKAASYRRPLLGVFGRKFLMLEGNFGVEFNRVVAVPDKTWGSNIHGYFHSVK